MIDPMLELSVRLALAILFAVAAWHKLRDRSRFIATVRAYRMLPSSSVAPVAMLLPVAEAFVAIGLLSPRARELWALAAVTLLSLYTFAIAANLALGRRDIDCGCFASTAKVPLSGWLVARNALLILAAGLLLLPVGRRPLVGLDALTVAATLVTLMLLWAAGRRLAQTGPALRGFGGTP